ncbi:uncharacterized protein G2W53_004549 [Senna tora]|uniref:Uncharacterized protein n=1 Tax=Senna tora TaxID=362788 RepID=A0A835CI63_9FABA|nr:uncharacterized protein G2W53_004549 [Senna tora]
MDLHAATGLQSIGRGWPTWRVANP